MRLLHSVCVEIILLATLVASSEVEILVPSSPFGCSSSTVKVLLQKVVGHFSNGTAVVFDRYWASDSTVEKLVERLPDPFTTSNIRDCADFIASEGYFAFEFLQGECTAILLLSDLCCEDTSGSHIYVSELFDGGSGEVPPVTDEETGVTMQSLPPMLIDIATIPEVSSSTDDDDLQPEDGNVALKDTDGTIYTFPLLFLDADNCIGTSLCGPVYYYNRNSPPPTSHYLSDHCGGELPYTVEPFDVIFSHRGFGCEYMPDELVGQDCVVNFTARFYLESSVHFFDLDDSDSCDGFNLIFTSKETFESNLCLEEDNYIYTTPGLNQLHMLVTKQQRLGFVLGAFQ
ncbi:hypothetical protein FHG87_009247 [Trinorchestia longiramus]|nr:hypothetical protein FHG87_009247 [Trinorchestia longiramus]